MKIILFIYLCFTVTLFAENKQTSFLLKRENLISDSSEISRILWNIKDGTIKGKLKEILKIINKEQKLYKPYPVDFYFFVKKGHRYKKLYTKQIPVEILIDSLSEVISSAQILRIHKTNFKGIKNGKIIPSKDNSYMNLSVYPEYKSKERLRDIFIEAILTPNKKRSMEWIWGRSLENDAFYSTKLTVYEGQFSIYPNYRTFIGRNSFRNKNSWFFDLAYYTPPVYGQKIRPKVVLAKSMENNIDSVLIKPQKTDSMAVQIKLDTLEILTNKIDISDTTKFDVYFYDKTGDSDSYKLVYEKNMNIRDVSDSLEHITKLAKFLKLDKIDLKFQNGNTYKNKYDEVIELLEANRANTNNKFASLLSQASKDPDKRRSVEWILNKSRSDLSYYAVVLTAYNGQLTIFNKYKKVAKSTYRKDKNSWFNQLQYVKKD